VFVSLKPGIYLNIIPKFSTFLTENIGSITETRQFILGREIIPVYRDNYKKYINALYGQGVEFVMLQCVIHVVTTMV
jgi:hypothetical protein